MTQGLEHISHQENERAVGFFTLENRRILGRQPCGLSILQGAYKEDSERLFNRACADRTRGSSFELQFKIGCGFRWDAGQNFLMMRVVEHWNRLHKQAVHGPPLEVFKAKLGLWVTWSSEKSSFPYQDSWTGFLLPTPTILILSTLQHITVQLTLSNLLPFRLQCCFQTKNKFTLIHSTWKLQVSSTDLQDSVIL